MWYNSIMEVRNYATLTTVMEALAGDTDNLSFTTLIRVAKPCACNPNVGASLQVQVDTAVTLTNASMTVVKVA